MFESPETGRIAAFVIAGVLAPLSAVIRFQETQQSAAAGVHG